MVELGLPAAPATVAVELPACPAAPPALELVTIPPIPAAAGVPATGDAPPEPTLAVPAPTIGTATAIPFPAAPADANVPPPAKPLPPVILLLPAPAIAFTPATALPAAPAAAAPAPAVVLLGAALSSAEQAFINAATHRKYKSFTRRVATILRIPFSPVPEFRLVSTAALDAERPG